MSAVVCTALGCVMPVVNMFGFLPFDLDDKNEWEIHIVCSAVKYYFRCVGRGERRRVEGDRKDERRGRMRL